MNHAAKTSPLKGKPLPDMTIAWEALPSLQHLVVRSEEAVDPADAAPTWAATMPVSLEAMSAPAIFREPLEGLSMRDLEEPEIFNVFFGDKTARVIGRVGP